MIITSEYESKSEAVKKTADNHLKKICWKKQTILLKKQKTARVYISILPVKTPGIYISISVIS